MEHLDGARGDAHMDFGANERVRHRVEKVRRRVLRCSEEGFA
jgi:hypothetical protein